MHEAGDVLEGIRLTSAPFSLSPWDVRPTDIDPLASLQPGWRGLAVRSYRRIDRFPERLSPINRSPVCGGCRLLGRCNLLVLP
jgi:hypothetical protein